MAVAPALGDFENVVGFQAIDHEVAVETGTEDFLGNLMTACAFAGTDDINSGLLAAEDPQPGVQATDAPAGFIGMHDVALPEGLDEQFIGGLGQVGEALLGADEGGGADFQLAVGLQEVADLAVTDAEAVLHLGGHGQDYGAEGVAGGADGVGSLIGVAALPVLAAARAIA